MSNAAPPAAGGLAFKAREIEELADIWFFRPLGMVFALAARAMRHILTDHARRRLADRRGGGRALVAGRALPAPPRRHTEMSHWLPLDEALTKLGTESDQAARVVELLFFGIAFVEEAADALGVSPRTVDREWRFARAWLLHALRGESA